MACTVWRPAEWYTARAMWVCALALSSPATWVIAHQRRCHPTIDAVPWQHTLASACWCMPCQARTMLTTTQIYRRARTRRHKLTCCKSSITGAASTGLEPRQSSGCVCRRQFKLMGIQRAVVKIACPAGMRAMIANVADVAIMQHTYHRRRFAGGQLGFAARSPAHASHPSTSSHPQPYGTRKSIIRRNKATC